MTDALLVALTREATIVNAAARACGTRITLQVSGIGPTRARAAAQRQVAAGATSLISVGFAGALRMPLRVGDLLLAREVVAPSGHRFAADAAIHCRLRNALSPRFQVRLGALASVERVVDDASRKSALGRALDADAVDMESVAIARVAHDAGIAFAVLRVVCDGPLQRIPRCTEGAVDALGQVNVSRLVTGLALRPWELLQLLRLGQGTAHAGRILERALCAVFGDVRK